MSSIKYSATGLKKYKVVTKFEQWIIADSEQSAIEIVNAGEWFEDKSAQELKVIETKKITREELDDYKKTFGDEY